MPIPYNEIAEELLTVAKLKCVKQDRRKLLYSMVKRYAK